MKRRGCVSPGEIRFETNIRSWVAGTVAVPASKEEAAGTDTLITPVSTKLKEGVSTIDESDAVRGSVTGARSIPGSQMSCLSKLESAAPCICP